MNFMWYKFLKLFCKKPIPEQGTLMSLAEFQDDVRDGALTDEDGYGYYSDGKFMYEITVVPSDRVDTSFSHVLWLNK